MEVEVVDHRLYVYMAIFGCFFFGQNQQLLWPRAKHFKELDTGSVVIAAAAAAADVAPISFRYKNSNCYLWSQASDRRKGKKSDGFFWVEFMI